MTLDEAVKQFVDSWSRSEPPLSRREKLFAEALLHMVDYAFFKAEMRRHQEAGEKLREGRQ